MGTALVVSVFAFQGAGNGKINTKDKFNPTYKITGRFLECK